MKFYIYAAIALGMFGSMALGTESAFAYTPSSSSAIESVGGLVRINPPLLPSIAIEDINADELITAGFWQTTYVKGQACVCTAGKMMENLGTIGGGAAGVILGLPGGPVGSALTGALFSGVGATTAIIIHDGLIHGTKSGEGKTGEGSKK